MNRVTIDNLDIRSHDRYAKDQEALDRKYINESTAIAAHSEILGTSAICFAVSLITSLLSKCYAIT